MVKRYEELQGEDYLDWVICLHGELLKSAGSLSEADKELVAILINQIPKLVYMMKTRD